MAPSDKNKLNRLEDLKKKLFDKNYEIKIEHRDSFPHYKERDVVDSWEKKEPQNIISKESILMKTSIFKKFFMFSSVFFLLALLYAAYIFFAKGNTVSTENIDILVQSNAFTAGGEEYSLLLEILNRNNSALQLADLIIEYPKSSVSSTSVDSERIRLSLGTIPSGGRKNENVKFVIFGEQGTIRPVKITVEYRVEGSNAIFVRERIYDITISSTPVNLLIDAPTEANSNQDINFRVNTVLNATKTAPKMLLKIDYPIGFQFTKSTPMPSSNNNVWNLGDLAPGAERKIDIVGKMVDVFEGEEKIFRVWSGSQSPSDKSVMGTVFNSLEHKVLIRQSSIEARLSINGVADREYAVDTKTGIEGQIQWKNNLETKINNLEIRAKIYGNAVNRKTISARQGFYNSSEDIIIWDRNSNSALLEADPGESGTVSFSLLSLSLFSASSGLLSSPSVNIDISITGEQSETGGSVVELASKESRVVKIISDVGLSAKSMYSLGPLQNTGPLPPKAEQTTSYTINWSVSNTANPISKAQVRATIPSWITFKGVFLPATEDLSYNAPTREIIWNVGNISRGTGITNAGREVSFQLEFTPSLSQVNSSPLLLNESSLTGHDDFANVDVRVRKSPVDIRLLGDPGMPPGGDRVAE